MSLQFSLGSEILNVKPRYSQLITWFCEPGESLDSRVTEKFPYVKLGKKKLSPGNIKIWGNGKDKRFVLLLVFDEEKSLSNCLKKVSEIKGLKSVSFPDSKYTPLFLKWGESIPKFKIDIVTSAKPLDFLQWVWEQLKKNPLIDTDRLENEYARLTNREKPEPPESETSESFDETWENTTFEEYVDEFVPPGWEEFFDQMNEGGYTQDVSKLLEKEKKSEIAPDLMDVLSAFEFQPPQKLRVILIGQDPYHTPGAAMGLAFSTPDGWLPLQPSLGNIYKEMLSEGFTVNRKSGNLSYWADQGVFLINTALTVLKGRANSHSEIWQDYTDRLFMYLNEKCEHLVVIMWGLHAKKKSKFFDEKKHFKIYGVHPSPYNRGVGFFGTKPFSKTNTYLEKWGYEPIDWSLGDP